MINRRIIVVILLAFFAGFNADGSEAVFSRTRHKAGLLALIEYNESPSYQRSFVCKKAQLTGICRMMIQEGGYEPKRLYAILNITDPEVEYVAMIMDELQGAQKRVPRPGSMILASTVAFAYTVPSPDGMRAAVHAGRLGGVDEDCDAVCRAVYALIIYAIEGKIDKKDELINVAALNAGSDKVSRLIRGMRLAEWRKLPKESTLAGRLARVLFLWRRCEGFSDAVELGRRKLLYPESRKLLAVLSACWTDLPYLPENFVWKALMDKDNREICAELYKLSQEAILARVPEDLVYGKAKGSIDKSVVTVNGKPVTAEGNVGGNLRMPEITRPSLPEQPSTPDISVLAMKTPDIKRVDIPQTPGINEIDSLEQEYLQDIKPLDEISEIEPSVKVIKPVDIFGGAFFAK